MREDEKGHWDVLIGLNIGGICRNGMFRYTIYGTAPKAWRSGEFWSSYFESQDIKYMNLRLHVIH